MRTFERKQDKSESREMRMQWNSDLIKRVGFYMTFPPKMCRLVDWREKVHLP